jgi:uncharacterized protein
MRISGAHVLVTGGSHGIGVEIAREFTCRGASVTVLGRNATRLEAVAGEICGRWVQADLADENAVATVIQKVEDAGGEVDILINNAGITLVRPAALNDAGDAKRLMMINAIAPMELVRQALPGMIARGRGHVVNISSLAGVSAVPDLSLYCASKAALHHYTAVVQRELVHSRALVGMTLVTLGEVAGTQMMEDARISPTIAAVSERMARIKALPSIAPGRVAKSVANAVERNATNVSVPRRIGSMIGLHNLPSRLQDLALIGLRPQNH